jgi:myosin-crossreactive antigen
MSSEKLAADGGGSKQEALHFLVGGDIASFAAAAFLIRDAGVPGERIRMFAKEPVAGGSLDGAGRGRIALHGAWRPHVRGAFRLHP